MNLEEFERKYLIRLLNTQRKKWQENLDFAISHDSIKGREKSIESVNIITKLIEKFELS